MWKELKKMKMAITKEFFPSVERRLAKFYILWTVHHVMILGKWPTWYTNFFFMYLFPFITLYIFRALCAHHQERQIVSIQPLVTVILCWWPRCVQVGRSLLPTSATNIEWLLPEIVLSQFVSPDDEHDALETCRAL